MSQPTFNHTRNDGPFSPCPICARDMIEEVLFLHCGPLNVNARANADILVDRLPFLGMQQATERVERGDNSPRSDAVVCGVEVLRAAVQVVTLYLNCDLKVSAQQEAMFDSAAKYLERLFEERPKK